MKRGNILRITMATIMIVTVLILSACGASKLNGTYRSQGLIAQSFTFDKDGNVTMSAFGIDAKGTYVIKNDKIIITYSLLGFNHSWEQTYKKSGNSIIINGVEFVKQ